MNDALQLGKLIEKINLTSENISMEKINIMEVCGTHTHSIAKFGIKGLISKKINLISGPGCPVCVTHESYIDAAIHLCNEGCTIMTFGDLMRVKGTSENLLQQKAKGKDVEVIYSLWELIKYAKSNSYKTIVFLAVGFETTAPLIASVISEASKMNLQNLYFLTSIKIMPPIIKKILNEDNHDIQGIICPGNVSVIEGSDKFKFIYEQYNIPSAVCGFEAEDILCGIYFIIKEIQNKVENKNLKGYKNLYRRFVSSEGNLTAQKIINEVFCIDDVTWRGIGRVNNSALVINDRYSSLDAAEKFNLHKYFKCGENLDYTDKTGCCCSEVILGKITPDQCKLFRKVCTPKSPYGPCMVSSEGACAVYYRYGKL